MFYNIKRELNQIYKYEQFQENITTRETLIMQCQDMYSDNRIRNEIQKNIAIHLLDYYKEEHGLYSSI